MEKKRYFWLKLKEDFFEQKEIKKLRRQEGGDTSVLIYLKMQLHSLKNEGKVFFEGFEENICEEIALELDEDIEDVKTLFLFLQKYKLVEEISEDEFLISKVPESLVSEGTSAERMRQSRKKKCKTENSQSENSVEQCAHNSEQCSTINAQSENSVAQCAKMCAQSDVEIDIEKKEDQKIEREYEREIFSASRVENASEPEREVASLPLKNGDNFSVTEKLVEDLRPCYQGVDVRTEILKMRAWLVANPEKRKTSGTVMKFITGWLARTQSSPPPEIKAPPRPGGARFSDLTDADFET